MVLAGGLHDKDESKTTGSSGILPDVSSWDVRCYGSTQVALKVVSGSEERADAPGESSGLTRTVEN